MMQSMIGHTLYLGGRSQGYGAQHSGSVGDFLDLSRHYNPKVTHGKHGLYDSPDAYGNRQWQQEQVNTWSRYGGTPQPRRTK